ncbi:MAG: YjbQ family protein, partial [Leptolyngbya sp. SIO4C1]|nr:YjbQ family protein [Leptolyngbya sp. SIO4C1]
PPDEPINAHSHLMAMTLSSSETVPIIDGKLALGTYQSIMLIEIGFDVDQQPLFVLINRQRSGGMA